MVEHFHYEKQSLAVAKIPYRGKLRNRSGFWPSPRTSECAMDVFKRSDSRFAHRFRNQTRRTGLESYTSSLFRCNGLVSQEVGTTVAKRSEEHTSELQSRPHL